MREGIAPVLAAGAFFVSACVNVGPSREEIGLALRDVATVQSDYRLNRCPITEFGSDTSSRLADALRRTGASEEAVYLSVLTEAYNCRRRNPYDFDIESLLHLEGGGEYQGTDEPMEWPEFDD